MQYSTVTHKGQVTIPIDLRRALGIQEGDKVAFIKLGDGIALKAIQKVDLMALSACLPKPEKSLSVQEINRIIESQG